MFKISLILLVALAVQVFGQPLSLDSGKECFSRECPSTTTGCKKVVKTSTDKKSLNTDIFCLDSQNMVVKDYHESKDNPFGSSTTFESTSFSGTYTSGDGGLNINIHNNVEPLNNEVENFS